MLVLAVLYSSVITTSTTWVRLLFIACLFADITVSVDASAINITLYVVLLTTEGNVILLWNTLPLIVPFKLHLGIWTSTNVLFTKS